MFSTENSLRLVRGPDNSILLSEHHTQYSTVYCGACGTVYTGTDITMDRKIWAFSQKMSWLFWLFWLFLYLSLGKMAFSSWLFWLFAQKARLFWLFAKLGWENAHRDCFC